MSLLNYLRQENFTVISSVKPDLTASNERSVPNRFFALLISLLIDPVKLEIDLVSFVSAP
jgi:hypothetical protein